MGRECREKKSRQFCGKANDYREGLGNWVGCMCRNSSLSPVPGNPLGVNFGTLYMKKMAKIPPASRVQAAWLEILSALFLKGCERYFFSTASQSKLFWRRNLSYFLFPVKRMLTGGAIQLKFDNAAAADDDVFGLEIFCALFRKWVKGTFSTTSQLNT